MSNADLSVALADAGGGRRRAPQPQPFDEKATATPQAVVQPVVLKSPTNAVVIPLEPNHFSRALPDLQLID